MQPWYCGLSPHWCVSVVDQGLGLLALQGDLGECASLGSLFSGGGEGRSHMFGLQIIADAMTSVRGPGTTHGLLAACRYCCDGTVQIGLYHMSPAESSFTVCGYTEELTEA